jgi:hypothetical protein
LSNRLEIEAIHSQPTWKPLTLEGLGANGWATGIDVVGPGIQALGVARSA